MTYATLENLSSDTGFNKALGELAPDLRLLFNPQTKLFGVYQVRTTLVLGPDASLRPWKLFDIVDENGNPRLPNKADLNRAITSVYSARKLWDKGGDWYADQITAAEQAREQTSKDRTEATIRAAAREAGDYLATNRQTRI